MRNLIVILFSAFNIILLQAQTGIDGYVYIFADGFNGSSLQEGIYKDKEFWGEYDRGSACVDLDLDNYTVANGNLKLAAMYTPYTTCQAWNQPEVTKHYTFQELRTIRNYKYGRYKIKAWIPHGNGLFPAYWLFGGSSNPAYSHSEIDIFELYTVSTQKGGDRHGTTTLIKWDNNGSGHPFADKEWDWTPDIWSYYTLDWGPDWLNVFLNNNPVVIAGSSALTALSPGNMEVFISMQVDGGEYKGDPIPAEFPYYMYVDFFTIEYPIDCDEIINVNNYSSLYDENTAYAGKSIVMPSNNGSVIVEDNTHEQPQGAYLDLIACENIVLKPGFHAKNGSYFRAWIVQPANLLKSTKTNYNSTNNHTFNKYIINKDIMDTSSEDLKEYSLNSTNEDSIKQNFNSSINNEIFVLSPNPAFDNLNIILNDEIQNGVYIKIFDLVGREVYSIHTFNYPKIELDVSSIPKGLYFLKFIYDNNIKSEQIIIQ